MLQKAFKEIDHNKDGQISPREMMMFIWEQVDSNNDNQISLNELYHMIQSIADFTKNKIRANWKADVAAGFKWVDKNGDG